MMEGLRSRPAGQGPGRTAHEGVGRRVHRDHPPVQIERHEPVGEGSEDVIGVALQVGQLREALAQRRVGRLQLRPLPSELRGHLVECHGQPAQLVGPPGLDALVQLPTRDRRDAVGELADRPGDPPGSDRGGQAAQHEGDDGEARQLAPGPGDLRVHPLARDADPHGAPALALDQDRHRDVVERLPRPRPTVSWSTGAAASARSDTASDSVRPTRSGRPAVRHDLAEPVQDQRVGHVGLAGEAHDVLLEGGEVVEQRARPPRRRPAPPRAPSRAAEPPR